MYQVLLCTCRAIVLLIKAFVLPRRRCRCRRGLLKVPNIIGAQECVHCTNKNTRDLRVISRSARADSLIVYLLITLFYP